MFELNWIKEPIPNPATPEEAVNEELFRSGPKPHYLVCIYDGAVFDREETERLGRIKFRDVTLTAVKLSNEPDYTSRPFMQEHATKYPRAYQAYMRGKSDGSRHNIRLLPKVLESEIQEFLHLGIATLEDLVAYDKPIFELEKHKSIARSILNPKPRLKIVDGKFVETAA